jgi:hypothetical protein
VCQVLRNLTGSLRKVFLERETVLKNSCNLHGYHTVGLILHETLFGKMKICKILIVLLAFFEVAFSSTSVDMKILKNYEE